MGCGGRCSLVSWPKARELHGGLNSELAVSMREFSEEAPGSRDAERKREREMRGFAVSALAILCVAGAVVLAIVLAGQPEECIPAGDGASVAPPYSQSDIEMQTSVLADPPPAVRGDTRVTLEYNRVKMPKVRQAIQLRLIEPRKAEANGDAVLGI